MNEIKLEKSELDVDGFYDIQFNILSPEAIIKCSMYIHEDEIEELKNNIQLMYEKKLNHFIFKYDAVGLRDNIELEFILKDIYDVIINYNISNEDSIFKSKIISNLENIYNFKISIK